MFYIYIYIKITYAILMICCCFFINLIYWNIFSNGILEYIYMYIYIGILMKNVFIYPNIPLMGGSINGDTQNSWCVMEISNRKWMMARGTPILGNLHSDIMFHISHWYPRNMIFDFTCLINNSLYRRKIPGLLFSLFDVCLKYVWFEANCCSWFSDFWWQWP